VMQGNEGLGMNMNLTIKKPKRKTHHDVPIMKPAEEEKDFIKTVSTDGTIQSVKSTETGPLVIPLSEQRTFLKLRHQAAQPQTTNPSLTPEEAELDRQAREAILASINGVNQDENTTIAAIPLLKQNMVPARRLAAVTPMESDRPEIWVKDWQSAPSFGASGALTLVEREALKVGRDYLLLFQFNFYNLCLFIAKLCFQSRWACFMIIRCIREVKLISIILKIYKKAKLSLFYSWYYELTMTKCKFLE
jgi:hypothetical protein